MASLKLTTTLGTEDAARLGLEGTKEGDTVEVSGKVADELIRNRWAEGEAKPAKGAEAADAEVDLEGMTKHELAEYAAEMGIEGVTIALTKDEMIRAIQDGMSG